MNGRGVFTPKESEERKLKEMGNTSEEFVFNYLKKNNFKNVDFFKPESSKNESKETYIICSILKPL